MLKPLKWFILLHPNTESINMQIWHISKVELLGVMCFQLQWKVPSQWLCTEGFRFPHHTSHIDAFNWDLSWAQGNFSTFNRSKWKQSSSLKLCTCITLWSEAQTSNWRKKEKHLWLEGNFKNFSCDKTISSGTNKLVRLFVPVNASTVKYELSTDIEYFL